MEKITEFQIMSLTLVNFKRFTEKITFSFEKLSYISGDNGQGKSSLADAIAYAFCGTPFWGDKGIDRLANDRTKEMVVELAFVDKDGELHNLIRQRKNDVTSIIFDEKKLKQSDLSEIFVERDIFLSIFNPLYFIEKLANGGREFLQKLLPIIKKENVLNSLGDYVKTLLENESLLDPEQYLKNKRQQIVETNNTNTYLDGQVDLLQMQLNTNTEDIKALRASICEVDEKIVKLLKKQFSGINVPALEAEKAEMLASISSEKSAEIKGKLAKAEASTYVSGYTKEISALNTEVKNLYNSYFELQKEIDKLEAEPVGSECPLCKTKLSADNAGNIISDMKTKLSKTLERGKEQKAQLDELIALDKKAEETFLKFREDDINKYKSELEQLPQYSMEDVSFIDNTLKFGNLSESEFAELESLKMELSVDNGRLKKLPSPEALKKDIDDLKDTIKIGNDGIKDANVLISAVTEYAAKKAELSLVPLKMNRAAIKLYEVIKSTGEIKNAFIFTYDGKDYRWLSTSEKIRAGMEVSDMLRNITGCNYPTFIDNAECITSMQKVQGQILLAYVKKGAILSVAENFAMMGAA